MAWGLLKETGFLTVDAKFEFFLDLSASTSAFLLDLNPRETATLVFRVDGAGTTDDIEIEVLQGHQISSGNTFDAVSAASNFQLDTAADGFGTDGDLDGAYIVFLQASAPGGGRLITSSSAADDSVEVSHSAPSVAAGDAYALYNFSPFRFLIDPDASAASDNQNNDGITVHAANGRYVMVVGRATGTTDAHRIKMTVQADGVSA